jgi:hypothetical protein
MIAGRLIQRRRRHADRHPSKHTAL